MKKIGSFLCIVILVFSLLSVTALAVSSAENNSLSMNITGVSVRYDSPAGIRFMTEVDKNAFFKAHYS